MSTDFSVEKGESNGLESVVIRSSTGESSTEILLFGGTLVSWVCEGKERIFVSPDAIYNGKKAIRGGIPLVFPQFGQPEDVEGNLILPSLSQHGFARNSAWVLNKTSTTADSGTVSLVLVENEETLSVWPFPFRLEYFVTLSKDNITTDLRIANTGFPMCAFYNGWSQHQLFVWVYLTLSCYVSSLRI